MMSAVCGKPSVRSTAAAAPGPKGASGSAPVIRPVATSCSAPPAPSTSAPRSASLRTSRKPMPGWSASVPQQPGAAPLDLLAGGPARRGRGRRPGRGCPDAEHDRFRDGGPPAALRSAFLAGPVQRGAGRGRAPRAPLRAARRPARLAAARSRRCTRSRSASPVARRERSRPGSGRGRTAARSGRAAGRSGRRRRSAATERSSRRSTLSASRLRGAGVVGDLVVGDEVGVDGGAAGEHVADDGGDHHVPFDDGREGAQHRVQAAAADPRPLAAQPGAQWTARPRGPPRRRRTRRCGSRCAGSEK